MITRTIQRITTAPLHPGFLGPGHQAAAVIDGRDFPRTAPFNILMDDRLDLSGGTGTSSITLHTGDQAARVLLYAGRPHGAPIVSHGPFIGDTQADIIRLYQEFRQGKMPHLNDLPEERKVRYGVEV